MNPPENNDPLDALLREREKYIDDNGFSARVVAALPRRRRSFFRPILLLGAVAINLTLAAFWLPWDNLHIITPGNTVIDPKTLLPLALAIAVLGSLVWATVSALE
jgi:hypothetical protein